MTTKEFINEKTIIINDCIHDLIEIVVSDPVGVSQEIMKLTELNQRSACINPSSYFKIKYLTEKIVRIEKELQDCFSTQLQETQDD